MGDCARFGRVVFLAWGLAKGVHGAEAELPADTFSATPLFQRGQYEAAFNTGPLFSPFIASRKRPTLDYTISEVQLGYMLSRAHQTGWMPGNFEAVAEAFGGAVFEGPGGYVSGGTLWLRYNLVPPGWRVVPYAQAGGGVVATDIDHQIVGQPFNFNLDLGTGMRCFLAPRWALNLEYRYQHISNANLGKRNLGINAHGPMLGLSYFF